MSDRELALGYEATQRMLDEYDPVKKTKSLRRLAPEAAYPQQILLVNKATGERIPWGRYKPIDLGRANEIKGRLGDLLHPKRGLNLGLPNDPWYEQTRQFLRETYGYLHGVWKRTRPSSPFEGLDHVEMVRSSEGDPN